jgi:hypothetical protein
MEEAAIAGGLFRVPCTSFIPTLAGTIAGGVGTTAHRPLHLYPDIRMIPQ